MEKTFRSTWSFPQSRSLPTPCPKFNLEKEFQTWVGGILKDLNWHYYKIPDTGLDYKPYDFICRGPEGAYHCEAKAIDGDSLQWNDVRPSQHKALSDCSWFDPQSAQLVVYSKRRQAYVTIPYLDFKAMCGTGEHRSAKLF
jgi:hypothetical protein